MLPANTLNISCQIFLSWYILFGNKKEKERLQKERLADKERQRQAEERKIAEEREKRLSENRRKEVRKMEEERTKDNKEKPADAHPEAGGVTATVVVDEGKHDASDPAGEIGRASCRERV